MGKYIVIDGGTTNTRVALMCDGRLCALKKLGIGAGAGDREKYRSMISAAINELSADGASLIIAAGMITSELGLYSLPHIEAPAGISELSSGMKCVSLPEISPLPFYFASGVKTVGAPEKTDMMRGEECEVFGLYDRYGDALYVLPGSHSKLIEISGGKISAFSTMLTGEMIAALSGSTILRDAVDLSVEKHDSDYLLKGYSFAKEHGLNEALFKTRILKNLFGAKKEEVYSFFLGAVLEGEIAAILRTDADRIVIAGKRQLREATAEILRFASERKIETADEAAVECSTFLGMIKVYENKKQVR